MNLELLPNEILLNLFEYFSISHLFHAFCDLNTRFHQLLRVQLQQFHLDLRLLSKTQFSHICQNYVPLIPDRIISLHLSDDDDTSQEIGIFLSYLPCLMHLTFTLCYKVVSENDAERRFNHIWSPTNLTYCSVNSWLAFSDYFPNPTVIFLSLRHLIVPRLTCSLSKLTGLCQNTPNLEYLSINFKDYSDQPELTLPILPITRLEVYFDGSIDYIIEHFLQNMPNLSHLT